MSSESARKELKELQGTIRKKGFKIVPGRGGHVKILNAKGQKVVDEHGPVILSTSPSDFRARDLAAARLIRAGVLTKDDLPWKPQKPKGLLLGDADNGEDESRLSKFARQEQEREQKKERGKDESRSRHERTQDIRARLEPLMTSLGGWGKRGMISEMGDVCFRVNEGAPGAYPSKQAASIGARSLRSGGTLSDDKAACWEAVVQILEAEDHPRDAWMDMVRKARGLPPRVKTAVAYRPGSVVEQGLGAGPERLVQLPEGGDLAAEMEARYPAERWSQGGNGPNPLLELHRKGGVRWICEFTDFEYTELSRALGFFEGLAVQLHVFDGQELVEPALDRLRKVIEKVGEARFRELAKAKEGGG